SSRRRHTRFSRDWSSDVCSSDLVRLSAVGRAHSRGDQVVTVPDADVLFTGDLAETGQFAIFPWFPPHDTDVSGPGWITVMERLRSEERRVGNGGRARGGREDDDR